LGVSLRPSPNFLTIFAVMVCGEKGLIAMAIEQTTTTLNRKAREVLKQPQKPATTCPSQLQIDANPVSP
jgi:hypothetical protein